LVLSKPEDPAQLVAVDWLMRSLERARGLTERGIEIMLIISTARGMVGLRALAACAASLGKRVRRFCFGAGGLHARSRHHSGLGGDSFTNTNAGRPPPRPIRIPLFR